MLLTALLLAQYAGTLDLSETSRLDARASQPLPVIEGPPREIALASDATFAPLGRLRFGDRRWDWAFTYSPTFNITDIELGPEAEPVVVNAGSASVAWHDRRVRISVSESASYGVEDLGYLYATPVAGQPSTTGTTTGTSGQGPGTTTGPTMGQTPGQTSGATQGVGQTGATTTSPTGLFPFATSNTNVSLSVRASRSVSVSVAGGYSLSGSLSNNPNTNILYPEQYGPLGSLAVSYAASRADTLITTASGQDTTTPMGACVPVSKDKVCRQDVPVSLVQETYRHALSATASLGATLGASGTVYQLNNGTAFGILPVIGINYTQRLGEAPRDARGAVEPPSLRLSADLVPTVNVFTGLPSNRVQLAGTLINRLTNTLGLSVTAGFLQTVPIPVTDPSPVTLLSGGADLKFRLTRLITASMGVQAFWQTQQNVGVVPTGTTTTGGATTTTTASQAATEVGYIALTARLPTFKL